MVTLERELADLRQSDTFKMTNPDHEYRTIRKKTTPSRTTGPVSAGFPARSFDSLLRSSNLENEGLQKTSLAPSKTSFTRGRVSHLAWHGKSWPSPCAVQPSRPAPPVPVPLLFPRPLPSSVLFAPPFFGTGFPVPSTFLLRRTMQVAVAAAPVPRIPHKALR